MTPTDLYKIFNLSGQQGEDGLKLYVEQLLAQYKTLELNRLAAEVVMGLEYCDEEYLLNGKRYCWAGDYRPCTDSNQLRLLKRRVAEITPYMIAEYTTKENVFEIQQFINISIKQLTSDDNSAGVALCIIAVIESVFAESGNK